MQVIVEDNAGAPASEASNATQESTKEPHDHAQEKKPNQQQQEQPQENIDDWESASEAAPEPLRAESKQGTPKPVRTCALRDSEQEWAVYPESNYSFEYDSALGRKWSAGVAEELLLKRQEAYMREGTRRSVAALFLVHRAEYPHVLLLLDQKQQKHSLVTFKYKTWQKPREVLYDKLQKHLIKLEQGSKRKWVAQQASAEGAEMEVGEFLGEWWRGEFDDELVPYLPPHVTRPKERVRVHQVQLPYRCSFRVPMGFCLTAIPIFELTPHRVGTAIGGLSHILARFSIRLRVPTADKYEAASFLENKIEPDAEGAWTGTDIAEAADRSEAAVAAGETNQAPEAVEDLEVLPPELQHLAELEEAL
ncbi:pre-mRNA cleavage factor Im 25 kDa subunit 2 [Cyclospora cayetanensis]|uniref:Pre-mRNA cleavage factor Im 25 kDa subunit 2 n=2 Tax=Cyclospora cayetanensis TaxID=88456 RepID=A0A6P5WDI6_9EIME|nr:pre-mRNA cleavage factor Im 25 kDa subunit 2 [Cyclospora cayetanensis]OEH77256.1 mRNA cleavage factor-like [Cyclospora cayetanensis]